MGTLSNFARLDHMKKFTSQTQKFGRLGEQIACDYLKNKGFTVIEQNYTKKIGELDIIASKNSILHFVEVKTLVKDRLEGVSRDTYEKYSPFENVSKSKMRKFSRTCEWYIQERHVSHETKWQIDVIAVTVTRETRSAKVEVMWNVIL
jgi:putative endonuclease